MKPRARDELLSAAATAVDMSRLGVIGGYEAAAAVLMIIIASLSAWGAFLIYRAVKGQRKKRGSEDRTSGTEKEATGRGSEDEDDSSKSTGSDDGASEDWDVDSRETILSTANRTQASSDLLEENLRKTAHENVKEPTAEPLIGAGVGDTTGTGRDHVRCIDDVRDASESISVQSDLFDHQDDGSRTSVDKPENSVKENACDDEESEIEPHVDMDEPSETESAQEILEAKNLQVQKCQSVEDLLDNTLLSQEIVTKPIEEEMIVDNSLLNGSSDDTSSDALHKKPKMEDTEGATKALETSIPQLNDLGSYCHDLRSDPLSNVASEEVVPKKDVKSRQDFSVGLNSLQTTVGNTDEALATEQHLSSTFDHILPNPPQNYLGFTVPGLSSNSLAPLQLAEESKDKTVVTPADVGQKKNEISIMEAIMDSNEWLSTGPPDTRDLPWLAPTPSKTGYGFKADISSSPVPSTTNFGLPAEEKMSHQGKTDAPEDATTGVTKDEGDLLNKKVGTVLPMPQLVQVSFRVHYITHSPKQILAVTGNQQELGSWESFVPLRNVENGFWFCTISLPLDSQVEWKFILVEEGKIRRWEECENRFFAVTGQEEEIHLNKNWGYA